MRPQDDDPHTFFVFLTEKGVMAVTDPMQIAIYDSLCEASKRPSDLAEGLGVPSSTLHFSLDKMVETGLIVRLKPDPSKREVYYSPLAMKIVGSEDPSPQAVAYSEETFKNPDARYTGLASVSNMLEAYLGEIGFNHDQLRDRYVRGLATELDSTIGKGSLEEVMQTIRDSFCSITGYRMSVYSLSPPTMIFEGDSTMAPKMDMLTRFVMHMMEFSTGRTMCIRSIEDLSSEESLRFKVTYDRAEATPEQYLNTSLFQSGDQERFMVIEADGKVMLITNEIHIPLIEAMYERPLCVTDVVNIVNMPRSTVTTNLLKLVEQGVATVFYAESGAMYYGVSCSILMKRGRKMEKNSEAVKTAIRDAMSEDGFMKGYLEYLLASLKELGFDTDYMMVVLGAKYMRTAGQDGPKNFDSYFGKMSEIARIVGLSLNVASVYPLTIAITRADENSDSVPAMTFVKGMAHQGLEMASSGMFVRVSEETPVDMKVSFKEIYPSLSMNPTAGADVSADADAAPVKKKRTSSVRDALRIRSARSDGKPLRTVRYITGVAVVAFAAFLLIFSGILGNENTAYAESYTIDADGIIVLDENGDALDLPYTVKADATVSFMIDLDGAENAGIVMSGVAYPLDKLYSSVDGIYTVKVTSNLEIEALRMVPVSNGLAASMYDFGAPVGQQYAYAYEGYISAGEYISEAGALWASNDAWVVLTPPDNCYVSLDDYDTYYIDSICIPAWEDTDASAKRLPSGYVNVYLDGLFEVDGQLVEDSLKVARNQSITLRFLSTDGPVKLILEQSGMQTDLALTLDRMVTFAVNQDVIVSYEHVGIQ